MLERIARGLGVIQAGPPTGSTGGLSGSVQAFAGYIPMVPAMGAQRFATFRNIYLSNPWVWAAVEKKSRDLSRLPIYVYELDEYGDKTRVRSDIATVGRPSGGQSLDQILSGKGYPISRNAMVGSTARDKLVHGNALWEILRNDYGQPSGLSRIRWRDVTYVQEDIDGNVIYYRVQRRNDYGVTAATRNVSVNDVIHFGWGSDITSNIGVSPLQACSATVALYDAVSRHLLAYFKNSARPSGSLKVEGLTEEQSVLVRKLITEWHATPENAGKVLVSPGEWQTIGDNPDHSSIVDLMKQSQEEVAAAYNIPPPVLGLLDKAIKANVSELREQYVRESLGADASDFEQELMAQLIPQQAAWSGLCVEFNLDAQLRPDLEARALVYQRMAFVYTVDDIRGYEGLPKLRIQGVTDVPWAASGYQPMSSWKDGNSPRPGGKTRAPSAEDIMAALQEWHGIHANGNGHTQPLEEVTS